MILLDKPSAYYLATKIGRASSRFSRGKSRGCWPSTSGILPRVICPGGVGFEISSASGGQGAGLFAKLTRPVIDGVSVRVIGIRLGLRSSKTDDEHVNANGEFIEHQTASEFAK